MVAIDVAIAIVIAEGRVLICRRREQAPLGGYWEFPGGKCEPGERPNQCAAREVREELGIEVRPTHAFAPIEFTYEHGAVRLHPFLCELVSGQPAALAAAEFRWVGPAELKDYRFPPANDDLIEELRRMLPPSR